MPLSTCQHTQICRSFMWGNVNAQRKCSSYRMWYKSFFFFFLSQISDWILTGADICIHGWRKTFDLELTLALRSLWRTTAETAAGLQRAMLTTVQFPKWHHDTDDCRTPARTQPTIYWVQGKRTWRLQKHFERDYLFICLCTFCSRDKQNEKLNEWPPDKNNLFETSSIICLHSETIESRTNCQCYRDSAKLGQKWMRAFSMRITYIGNGIEIV